MKSSLTTLCYIEKDNKYLMLHRVKKDVDINHGKWIGVGGHFLKNESPEECLLREVKEETGLTLTSYKMRGIITFISDEWETEYMFLYTADDFTGELSECDEGELKWVDKDKLMELNLWEGDRIFLKWLLEGKEFFSLKLVYEGNKLVSSVEE
ncbi:MAG: 8-oxo-dGTP diphosphatase [Eubacterium sp.]|nr:8-oxo-dGTP diphosphatase [Eubacterium sp.]